MKCNTCIYEWILLPDLSSPYGEYACYKKEIDLYEVKSEDVDDCLDYECKIKID